MRSGGVDYTLVSGSVSFGPGVTSVSVPLSVVNDSASEANETVVVGLSSPVHATLGSPSSHTYTILDDDASPNLSISKAGPASAPVGDRFAYDISARNQGPSTATGVQVVDTLPIGVQFISSDSAGCTHDGSILGGVLTCHYGTLASGGGEPILHITVLALIPGQWTNSVTISGNQSDPDPSDNTATVTTQISVLGKD